MALRAQRTRHRASWCDTVASVPTRLSVSSTIMRIRRRHRRSKIGERTSIVESIAYLPMLSYHAQTAMLFCAFLISDEHQPREQAWFECGTDTLVCTRGRLAQDLPSC